MEGKNGEGGQKLEGKQEKMVPGGEEQRTSI